ncbi:MAG: phage tail protein, partial [Desulfitobacteriaceae bacterium]|nr:phage tail protein [Desulfitobacteriaceae bacterium]
MIIRVPAIYLEDKETRALLDVMEQGFALILEDLANWTNILDPDRCPASVLPHMLFEEGWTEQIPLTEAQQRRLAKELPRLRKRRGTYKAIIPAIKIFTVEANKDYQVDIIKHRPSRTFWIRVPWRMLSALDFPSMFRVVWKFTAANEYFGVVGIPDRMLLLNQAGALVTVTQDLSWQETKTLKVFTGPRLNAAGPVEVTKIDQSWTETITHRLFTGPRLNAAGQVQVIDTSWQETITQKVFTGPRLSGSLKLNGTGRLNQAPSIEQIIPILHLAQERRFL